MPEIQSKALPPNPYNPFCWITGKPEIGEGTWIGAFTLIDGLGGLSIGKGCNISSGAQILSHSTVKRCVTERRYPLVDTRRTEVGDFVFVGSNAIIQMGCSIGHHSVVGAGAVILEGTTVPPYSLVVGVPARIDRSIKDDVAAWSYPPS
jgi:acetyltransferase-like isoleucine patch superfamily enzyme